MQETFALICHCYALKIILNSNRLGKNILRRSLQEKEIGKNCNTFNTTILQYLTMFIKCIAVSILPRSWINNVATSMSADIDSNTRKIIMFGVTMVNYVNFHSYH